jgi:hypothetical protein
MNLLRFDSNVPNNVDQRKVNKLYIRYRFVKALFCWALNFNDIRIGMGIGSIHFPLIFAVHRTGYSRQTIELSMHTTHFWRMGAALQGCIFYTSYRKYGDSRDHNIM